jgi:predicted SAM-dependent methyltransferase
MDGAIYLERVKYVILKVLGRFPGLSKVIGILSKQVQCIWFSIRKGRVRCFLHWLFRGHFARFLITRKYLAGQKNNLQIGGGYHTIDGWLNGDLIAGDIYLDATKRLPFPDNTFNFLFAEQFIEHLSWKDGKLFFQECHRVLRPGGVIRLSTPDLERLIQVYYDENPYVTLAQAMERHRRKHNAVLSTACHFINDYFHLWGHKFIYDEETLLNELLKAGFVNIKRCRFGKSKYEDLAGRERHADREWLKDGWILILEGVADE